jgi:hypothetical protein
MAETNALKRPPHCGEHNGWSIFRNRLSCFVEELKRVATYVAHCYVLDGGWGKVPKDLDLPGRECQAIINKCKFVREDFLDFGSALGFGFLECSKWEPRPRGAPLVSLTCWAVPVAPTRRDSS